MLKTKENKKIHIGREFGNKKFIKIEFLFSKDEI